MRRDPVERQTAGSSVVPLTRISHVRVEVTDLGAGQNLVSRHFRPDRGPNKFRARNKRRSRCRTPGSWSFCVASIKSPSVARARSKGRVSTFASRRNSIRRSWKSLTAKNITGDRTRQKSHGMSRADIRCTVTIRSAIGFRSATASDIRYRTDWANKNTCSSPSVRSKSLKR